MSTDVPVPQSAHDLLDGYPASLGITAADVRNGRADGARHLVVLDDDPTGTQSVAGLPVLTDWTDDDLAWALGTGAPAVYVMTNSRSLSPSIAAARNRQVATSALRAAHQLGVEIDFVSRSDSTLRGHYPLEPDVLIEAQAQAGVAVDGVLVVPAFGEAGRITVASIHYAGNDADGYKPVGETEFARDASFGYFSSDLRDWVSEKSHGRIAADDVATVTLDTIRRGPASIADALSTVSNGQPIVVDTVEETDLRSLALGILQAEHSGKRFVYRVGPPFVRALIGQEVPAPLQSNDVARIRHGSKAEHARFGLIVIGSHVDLTTRQLQVLRERDAPAEVEVDVSQVLVDSRDEHLANVVSQILDSLTDRNVVVHTSRVLVTGEGAEASLNIARSVSDAIVAVVQQVLCAASPSFVLAKGGITSSDVASRGLSISRAIATGPMLPGIISLWEPTEGPAQGIPYIVFAGNVGNDASLADVVGKLTA